MLIGKKYKVESDDFNVTLYEKNKSKNTGLIYWRPVAYFSNIKNALKFLVDKKVMETGLVELKTVIKKQEELYRLIKGLE